MRRTSRIAIAALLAALPWAGAAEEAAPRIDKKAGDETPVAGIATAEKLQELLKEAEEAADLDDELKKKIVDLLKQAQASLQRAGEHRALAENYKLQLKDAPARTAEIRARLKEESAAETSFAVPADATAKTFEQLLDQKRAELAAAKSELEKAEGRNKLLQGRLQKAREEQLAAREKIEERRKALGAPPAAGEDARFTEAVRLFHQCAIRARAEEIAMLDQEIVSQPARADLLAAERDLAARGVAVLQDELAKIEEEAARRRSAEAQVVTEDAERAKHEARYKHPLVKDAADDNAVLGRELAQIAADAGAVAADRRHGEEQRKHLSEIFERTRGQLERVGLQGLGGAALREQRARLPAIVDENRSMWARWRDRIGAAESRRFQISMDRHALADAAAAAARLAAKEPEAADARREDIAAALLPLLVKRGELLGELDEAYSSLLKNLRDMETVHAQLGDTARRFSMLLDEWLPWIPSAAPFALQTLRDLGPSLAWVLSPANWGAVGLTLGADVLRLPHYALLVLALAAGMLFAARWARRRLDAIAAKLGRAYKDSFVGTLEALALTALLAAPAPLAAAYFGWRLAEAATPAFAAGLGKGLLTFAEFFFSVRFFLLLCAPTGVASAHFHWEERTLALLRRHVRWIVAPLGATMVLVALAEAQSSEAIRNSLGRLAFIAGVMVQAVFIQRVLGPGGGIAANALRRRPTGWLARLRFLWYPVAVGVPVALAVTSAVGYHFTAIELERRVIVSIWIVVCAVLFHEMALRWFVVEKRRFAARQARERREAELKLAEAAGQVSEGAKQAALEEPVIDVSTIDVQIRSLLNTLMGFAIVVGLWIVWARVLPALAMLDNVRLWNTLAIGEGGAAVTKWITLGSLAVAAIALMLTIAAAKSLPGVLELLLLKNLPLDAGSRYAVTTVSQYLLAVAGVIFVFNTIGVGWSKVQWLAAALSLGVGFGLQEIVANFICGLILLFERPIRVGDIVTVGDVTGTVSRIRIRATTITNWDRMEYVVPNKDLITGRLLNWTLSNTVNRIVITVAVAQGTDTDKARAALLSAARGHPLVMRDPEPMATFEGFGEYGLNMVLRCFLADFANRTKTIHELHTAVKQAFAAANIELALPWPRWDRGRGAPPKGA